MTKTPEDIRERLRPLLEASRNRVRAYAKKHAPMVPRYVGESYVALIGEFDEGEIIAVLDAENDWRVTLKDE